MDSSFHLGRPLSSDGDSSSARNIQPNTSSLSLPPLRSIDPLVQQFGTHQAQGPGLAAQLPSPNFPPISQYHPPLPGISHHHGSMPSGYPPSNLHEAGTPGGPMDPFPQPPSLLISPTEVHRALATGRQKKEVKRRTKTGCLTCRKRRIKCDEGQPSCRNCSKSKRECLGYDPIFQAQRSVPTLQPLSPHSSPPGSTAYPALLSPSTYLGPTSPSTTQSYTTGSRTSSLGPMEYTGSSSGERGIPPTSAPRDRSSDIHIQGSNAETSPQSVPPISQFFMRRAFRVDIEELLKSNEQIESADHPIQVDAAESLNAVEAIYNEIYAPALDKFLETRWYSLAGLKALRKDDKLLSEFSAFFRAASHGPEQVTWPKLLRHETRLIWHLLNMCRSIDSITQDPKTVDTNTTASTSGQSGNSDTPTAASSANNDPKQTLHPETNTNDLHPSSPPIARLQALTSLLAHSPPPPSSEPTPSPQAQAQTGRARPSQLSRQLHSRSQEFWSCISRFVHAQPDDAAAAVARRTAVERARALLDEFENRDVVWSLMRARYLQGLFADADTETEIRGVAAGERHTTDMLEQESRFLIRVLRDEAGIGSTTAAGAEGGDGVRNGVGRNVVAMRIAGLAVRVLDE